MAEVGEATRPSVRETGIGASVHRKEDDRLLRGEGRFADDVDPGHCLHMAVGRCPFPHARIVSIDTSAAFGLEGVEDILVGSEVVRRTDPLSVLRPVPNAPSLDFYAMATDVALFEGHPVVSVAAVSRAVAEDAVALIDIDYDPLPHVFDVESAMDPRSPVLHPKVLKSNLLERYLMGDGEPEEKMAEAEVVIEGEFSINRVSGLPMETRAIVAEWQAGARELTVRHSTQTPHLVRQQLAESLRLADGAVHVIASDVGGGFGLKIGIYPEDVLACLHAMIARRPVKWIEDRVEFFRATTHARESRHTVRIGAHPDGEMIAMTDLYRVDLGGYNSPTGSPQLTSVMFTGPYKVSDARTERHVVITNKAPVGAYRGYGQPESCFVRELLVDRLAARLGIDRVELRAQNMVRPEDMPWRSTSGAIYDSGDYEACLRMAAEAIGYDDHVRAGRRPRADGRYLGVGIASFVERTGYASARFLQARGSRFGAHESVTLRANRTGGIDVYTGVSTFGVGSETSFAQILSDVTGVAFEAIVVHAGDTHASPLNTGGFASRTLIAAAGALKHAGEELMAKTLRIAAFALEAESVDDVEIAGDVVRLRYDPSTRIPLGDVHKRAIINQGMPPGETPGLEATCQFEPEAAAYAFGSAAAQVSVDPETGDFDVERFVMVHDCGVPVNPVIVDAQVRGGLAQGYGQAVMEELRYDPETGQLVNGTMMDYFMPTSADLPDFELLHTYVPSPGTPFGVRGVGEIGTLPGGATIANAICDALADFGIQINRLPLTPELVWSELEAARERGGVMKVSEEFVIAEPPATLWEFFEQFDQVAQCVPGVEDVTVIDEDNSRVRLTQSLGPMTATFDVKMRVTARDPGKSMEFTAVGRSVRGAAGNIRSNHVLRLSDEGEGSTRVFLEGDVALGGMLGSVGQKVVAKQAAVVTQSFARALQERLGGGAPPAAEPDRGAVASPPAGAAATGAAATGAAAAGVDAAGSPPPSPEPSGGRAKVVRFAMAGAIVLALVEALRRLRSR